MAELLFPRQQGVVRSRFGALLKVLGLFCLGFSITLLLPMAFAWWDGDGELRHFLLAWLITASAGMSFWVLGLRGGASELRQRDGFLVVALFWILLSGLGSIPFMLGPHLSLVDAIFEAASGLTTTGATVMSGLDDLPRSVLIYRQLLQWLGGMGMIVLAVAVMPLLKIGGMQLYRAEVPGPLKEEKIAPRLTNTARLLWAIYAGLTLICALLYWAAGMSGFDAFAHSLATLSTGGFSTHDQSLGYFHSATIEAIAVVFMLAGGINFSIHYLVWRDRSAWHYLRNMEVRTFLLFTLATCAIISWGLYDAPHHAGLSYTIRDTVFQVVSVITSTGFATDNFSLWPGFLPVLLIFISFMGGCGGSTAGGMKVMRWQLITLQGHREVRRLIHGKALIPLRLDGRVVSERTIESVWGFFAVYVITFVLLMLAMMFQGLDQVSAFSAVATSMNNLGPGLGEVATSFASISDAGKLTAVAAMLLGRLEVFTFLVLLLPEFWRN